MNTYLFEGEMTVLSSISHIGESYGVNSRLRREKVVQLDGTIEEVPVISGNAIRGILRDRGMLHMLKMLGYGVGDDGQVLGLSLAAFYFLFSGGALTARSGNANLDVDQARKWRNMIPLVAIFGGAMGNQIMPGKLKCGKAIPICRETRHLIPEQYVSDNDQSIWDMCQEEPYTRRDDEKNENLRGLIAPDVRWMLEEGSAAKRAKAGTKDDVAGDTGQSQQMRYFIETLISGTRLYWEIALEDVTDVEFEAMCITLAEFSRAPYIGGKSGVGHGKVAIRFNNWHEINPRLAPTGKEVDVPLGERYLQHLRSNVSNIRELIDGLE